MRMRMTAVVVAVWILVALAWAQASRGDIAGTVNDRTGAPLPGVTVSVSGPERRTAITNEHGRFSITGLLPGSYDIRSALAGFVTAENRVTVAAGSTARLEVHLVRCGGLAKPLP